MEGTTEKRNRYVEIVFNLNCIKMSLFQLFSFSTYLHLYTNYCFGIIHMRSVQIHKLRVRWEGKAFHMKQWSDCILVVFVVFQHVFFSHSVSFFNSLQVIFFVSRKWHGVMVSTNIKIRLVHNENLCYYNGKTFIKMQSAYFYDESEIWFFICRCYINKLLSYLNIFICLWVSVISWSKVISSQFWCTRYISSKQKKNASEM